MRLVSRQKTRYCRGFLSLDIAAALAVLALGATFMVQTMTQTAGLRHRNEIRLKGLETVANFLEAARGVPSEQLEEWAAQQKVNPDLEQTFSSPKLSVTVKKLPDRPLARQVVVNLSWLNREGKRMAPVILATVVAAREAPEKGARP